MAINTKHRSDADEIMDDFALEGEVLREALDKIAGINKLLGGNKLTVEGIAELLSKKPTEAVISILDVGCGNGDMLRKVAVFGKARGLKLQLTGMDANAFTIGYARSLSAGYDNISYLCADIFEELKQETHYDVILCTLTLHHFKDNEILALLTGFKNQARIGIVINDLHRSKIAYYLFIAVCKVFKLNSMSREDGLISILRGFKAEDLRNYAKKLGIKKYTLRWRWAFRYQWIIPTI
jgi:2-polyprenyl-3-methyl-5-hydroxy-6-metoxy-1,4-benzoquinol methylase